MIVPFEINTGILQNKTENASLLRSLAETIMDFGVIPWSQELQDAIKRAQCQNLTYAFLKTGSKTTSVPTYEVSSGVVKSNGVPGVIVLPSNDFDLQKDLVKDSLAEDRIVLPPGNTELVPLRNTTESEILRNRKTWSNETLDTKTMNRDLIWSERIKPVLANSLKWFLVDANFIGQFLDSRHNGPNWFIQQISEMVSSQNNFKKKIRFTIFSSVDDDSEASRREAEEVYSEIYSQFPSDKISLSLYASPEKNFRKTDHERYLRCNSDGLNRSFSLGDSLDGFDEPATRPPFGLRYSRDPEHVTNIFRDLENGLRNFSELANMKFSSEI